MKTSDNIPGMTSKGEPESITAMKKVIKTATNGDDGQGRAETIITTSENGTISPSTNDGKDPSGKTHAVSLRALR